nr:fatty acid amide hydrolase 1 [Hymenolepis microstoma]
MLLDIDTHRGKFLTASVCAISLYLVKNSLINYLNNNALNSTRNAKIAYLNSAKENFAGYLQQRQISIEDMEMITSLSLQELIEKLKRQELPVAYVLLAYQWKAFEVDKRLNCVTEFLYPDLSEVNLKGPLAGCPVSLKECFGMKGRDSCVGCARNIGKLHTCDPVALKVIRDLGGVPFVITNVPQTMMSTQCSNPINGVTKNPLRADRTPHGSSGGEAALIGAGGSILGFGTDLGGSIRLPSAMCGVVGFKPTTDRLSYRDLGKMGTAKPIVPCWGLICRDADTCKFVMELIVNSPLSHTLDPYTPPLPYKQIPDVHHLRIGYFLQFDDLVPVPAVRRALLETRSKLASRGHELVEWTPPFKVKAYLDLFLKSIFCDGCAYLKTLLANDKVDPCMQVIHGLSIAPWYQRMWLRMKMHWAGNWEGLAVLNAIGGFPSVEQLEFHIMRLKEFRNRVMDSLRSECIDVILCPVAGFAVALPLRPPYSTTGMLAFQNLANTLAIPAGTMPSGCVVEKRDIEVLRQAVEGKEIKAAMDDTEENFYAGYGKLSPLHRNMLPLQEGTVGLPIPVQFMSLPWQDELCLYAMLELERAMKSTTI